RYLGYAAGIGATVAFVWHFRSILSQRVLLLATVVTILVYAGNMIPSNMNLYSSEALDPEQSRNNLTALVTISLQNQPLVAASCSGHFVTNPVNIAEQYA